MTYEGRLPTHDTCRLGRFLHVLRIAIEQRSGRLGFLSVRSAAAPEIPENGRTATGGASRTMSASRGHVFVSPWSRPLSESSRVSPQEFSTHTSMAKTRRSQTNRRCEAWLARGAAPDQASRCAVRSTPENLPWRRYLLLIVTPGQSSVRNGVGGQSNGHCKGCRSGCRPKRNVRQLVRKLDQTRPRPCQDPRSWPEP